MSKISGAAHRIAWPSVMNSTGRTSGVTVARPKSVRTCIVCENTWLILGSAHLVGVLELREPFMISANVVVGIEVTEIIGDVGSR